MLFDPEDGLTLEQSIEIAWNNQTPAMQARVHALADHLGWTRNEVIMECQRMFLEDLDDPAKRVAYHAKMDRREAPFGKDPLLRKDGEA